MSQDIQMPKWNELFLVTLKAYSDGLPHNNRIVCVDVANNLNLPDELRNERNSKAGDNKIENRVGWAISALKIAGLLVQYERGQNRITDSGISLLKDRGENNFDEKFLIDNYPTYKNNKELNISGINRKNRQANHEENISSLTPEEQIENACNILDSNLQANLIEQLRNMDAYKFEVVVADLLQAMGYGESFNTKKSGDGGVDAIVNEDTLGLSKIYAQAKRYAENNIVQEKAIRDFLGSLSAYNVSKGIFITTSDFSDSAIKLATNRSIILINSDKLTELMIEYGVGVSVAKEFKIKRVDIDYFEQ